MFLSASNAAAAKLIAVLPLDVTNAEGRLTPAAQADLAEMLRDIAADTLTAEGWTVLTGDTTIQLLQDNGVDPSKCGDQSCNLAMAREIKAEKFLSGNVRYVDGLFTASIRLVDTATGRILASASIEGGNERALREDFHAKSADFFAKGGLIGAPSATPPPNLNPVPSAEAPPPAVAAPLAAKQASPLRGVGFVGIALGAAGLVAGAVLGMTAQADATALKQRPPSSGTIQSAQAGVNARVTGSIVALAAGGALTVTGVCLVVAF